MSETTSTFTVELESLPASVNTEELASVIADNLALPLSDAKLLVRSVPVTVLPNTDVASARKVAKALLKLGVDVSIRNDQSGEVKKHSATQFASAAARAPSAGLSEPLSAREPASLPPISLPLALAPADVPAASPDASGKSAALALCASCSRPVTKASHCVSCGWSNTHGVRRCRECGGALVMSSTVSERRALLAGVGAATIAGVGLGFYLRGGLAAGAVAALALAGLFVADSRTSHYRCSGCKRNVDRGALRSAESAALRSFGRKPLLVAVLCALVGAALMLPIAASSSPELVMDSFGIGWRAAVPASHQDLDRRVITVPSDSGATRAAIHRATGSRGSVREFVLLHAALPRTSPTRGDDPALQPFMASAVDAALGARLGATEAVTTPDGQPAREGPFEGQVSGRARLVVFEHEAVLLAFVAEGPDAPAGRAFFDGLKTVK